MTQMFTTCAACRVNLAVTPSDLRIGQGYVRCGRCNRVFNALLTLSEDLEQEEPGLAATGTTSVPALEDPGNAVWAGGEPLVHATPAVLPDDDSSGVRRAAAEAVDVVETQATGTFETIVLEGDSYMQTEEHVDPSDVAAQLQELARQIDTQNAERPPGLEAASAPGAPDEEIVLEGEQTADEAQPAQADAGLDADEAVGNRRRRRWIWPVLAMLLLLLLAGQVLHHNRQELVAHPGLERPLQSVYALFGVELEPRWDLDAYDLRQLGAESPPGAADQVVLRATVSNAATSRQPPPLIRAVLTDRFGNTVSTTTVAPADYMDAEVPERMQPDQRLDITLRLSDPARQAMGFEIDACLQDGGGKLHCSSDQ